MDRLDDGNQGKKLTTPRLRGSEYDCIMWVYATLLKNFGVLPSAIDEQKVSDFYDALMAKEPKTIAYIDQLKGW